MTKDENIEEIVDEINEIRDEYMEKAERLRGKELMIDKIEKTVESLKDENDDEEVYEVQGRALIPRTAKELKEKLKDEKKDNEKEIKEFSERVEELQETIKEKRTKLQELAEG